MDELKQKYVIQFWKITHMGAHIKIKFGWFYLEQKTTFKLFQEFSCNLRH